MRALCYGFVMDTVLTFRMRFSSSQSIIVSLCCLVGVSALAVCKARESSNSSIVTIRKCEEWEQAEAVSKGLGWDLVYEATLKKNNFGPDSDMWKWIHTDGPRPPVEKLVEAGLGEPITSSMLIEVVGPEGSPGGFWYIRTTNHLYKWSFHRGKFHSEKKELTRLPEFDRAFDEIACWQQGVPVSTDSLLGGYYGFLSLYKEGKSRQMLLTFRDFFNVDPRDNSKNLEDRANWGRMWKTLAPVLEGT